MFFAIVAKEIIEKKLCQKITYRYRKNGKNNKSTKKQDLIRREAKKNPEMSANIAKVTRIFQNAHDKYRKYRKNNNCNKIPDLERKEAKKGPRNVRKYRKSNKDFSC